jgi:hypothetical protein
VRIAAISQLLNRLGVAKQIAERDPTAAALRTRDAERGQRRRPRIVAEDEHETRCVERRAEA